MDCPVRATQKSFFMGLQLNCVPSLNAPCASGQEWLNQTVRALNLPPAPGNFIQHLGETQLKTSEEPPKSILTFSW